ncbi:MAG: peptide deformylase [Nitrososphaera sp.]|nr:peptide deformylase [Nitrososphaera sp.]
MSHELEICIFPNPVLRQVAQPVTPEQIKTPLIRETAAAMIRAMYAYHGVGLAAQQVGCPFAIIVVDTEYPHTKKKSPRVFYNPKIVEADPEIIQLDSPGEGCLSLPYGYHQPVPRYENIRVEWLDGRGRTKDRWFSGFDAIVLQHEVDHLDGRVFVDHLSKLKQKMFLAKVRKAHRHYYKGVKRANSAIRHAHKTRDFNLIRMKKWEEDRRAKNAEVSEAVHEVQAEVLQSDQA